MHCYFQCIRSFFKQFAVVSDNTLYAWGNNAMGQCGQGHCQSPVTSPRLVMGLEKVNIHQISAGATIKLLYTLYNTSSLMLDYAPYQCKLSCCLIPVGTSHTLAWTALPTDRQVVAWHRPFCFDLQETTFSLLRKFLEVPYNLQCCADMQCCYKCVYCTSTH